MSFTKIVLAGFCSLWLFALSAAVLYTVLRLTGDLHW